MLKINNVGKLVIYRRSLIRLGTLHLTNDALGIVLSQSEEFATISTSDSKILKIPNDHLTVIDCDFNNRSKIDQLDKESDAMLVTVKFSKTSFKQSSADIRILNTCSNIIDISYIDGRRSSINLNSESYSVDVLSSNIIRFIIQR